MPNSLIKKDIRKILIITLSNIGDCILTLPAMDILRRDFPAAQFIVLAGPKAAEIFQGDSQVNLVIYDKYSSIKEKIGLTFSLRKERFDLLIDFRNTAFPVLLRAKSKTSPFTKIPQDILHKKEQHLWRLKSAYDFAGPASPDSLFIRQEDRDYIELALGRQATDQRLAVASPGAANEWKRWTKEGFAKVCDWLMDEFKMRLVLVGDTNDRIISQVVSSLMRNKPLDLCGKTSLKQLAALLQRADLIISCDSAVMHMASYFNRPTIAVFGPSDPLKYGPWSQKRFVLQGKVECSPCEKSGCSENHECMEAIKPEQVIKVILENFSELKTIEKPLPDTAKAQKTAAKTQSIFSAFAVLLRFGGVKRFFQRQKIVSENDKGGKRFLVVRTDRIGDVLLTTPAFKALRINYPDSFISVMVAPIARDIVEGNPYIDEVIVYDKNNKDKGIFGFFRMVSFLRKRRFDTALVLHIKKRTNLLCFLAGIKERVGYYNNKFGFLLNKKIPDLRPQGKKHEAQYCLEVLRAIGIEEGDSELFMPLKPPAEEWAEEILKKYKVERKDKLIAINPGASCPSKIWPAERFAILADKLIEKYTARICLLSGPSDLKIASEVLSKIKNPVINLSGHTTISQVASFLKRCNLFITNDSGPMHIACAVGTPVVAIFGRNESGLSPRRWGPLGKQSAVLHKEVGCVECLAHNCQKGFACLLAITEEEVLEATDKLLKVS